MYITSLGHYLPELEISNEYFKDINGLSDEWIFSRTGMKTRRKVGEGENTNTMAIEATKKAIENLSFPLDEIDLIIGATYSPYDTVSTHAHRIQAHFGMDNVQVMTVASACSSFINAIEIAEGYFALNKASKALIVASENNTLYNDESNEKSGHLWGDGAAAMVVTKEKINDTDAEIVDVFTRGLANTGKGPEGVWLLPKTEGLVMPFGKDVFINACIQMTAVTQQILERNNCEIKDLNYLLPHQANIRIIDNVAKQLNIKKEQTIINVDKYGNTGCASVPIALSENTGKFKKGDLLAITVFGGGYSSGAALLKYN